MIISVSNYVKTNGNNPILHLSQMTSEARVVTELGESQGGGDRAQRRSGNGREHHMGSHCLALPCLALHAGACH